MFKAKANLLVTLVSLLILAGCQTQGTGPTDSPPSATPTLALTPASININAGDVAATFTASVQNSSESVTWTFSGPGSITPASGSSTLYTPPESVNGVQSGILTATLGATGVTATASIVIYPADVTPPSEPSPPDPPTDSDPPTTPDMTVRIANVDPVTLGEGGTASASLNASTRNSPGRTAYQWTAQGPNAENVSFSSDTSEDTTATFNAEGDYTLRLTASNGSRSASDTVNVTINPAPELMQGVGGEWSGTYTSNSFDYAMSLDLAETGEDVTGTLAVSGGNYPMEGTFDGTELTLTHTGASVPLDIKATVTGNEMSGTLTGSTGTSPFTLRREWAVLRSRRPLTDSAGTRLGFERPMPSQLGSRSKLQQGEPTIHAQFTPAAAF